MTDRTTPAWGLLAIAAALVLSAFIAAGAAVRVKRAADAITVTGSAKRPIRSDFIVWRGTVAGQQPTLAASAEELERYVTRTRAFLAAKGIPDSAITWRAVETMPMPEVSMNGRETGRILGYRLQRMFEVRSFDVDGISAIAASTGEVMREGVPLTTFPPEYLYTRLAEVRTEMLSEATKDARTRAEAIATSAGSGIGPVREARMGVFQITPRHSTEVSDYGINDVSSVEKDITAVVRVTFAVD
jgi:hypothetical protein